MRIRGVDVDLVVLGMAVVATAVGIGFGLGALAIGCGLLVVAGAYGSRFAAAAVAPRVALPPKGTPEREQVIRALAAATAMKRLVHAVRPGPVARRCHEMESQARTALPTIRMLAVQTFQVRSLAEGIPFAQLEAEHGTALSLLEARPAAGLRTELESSLRSTDAQLRAGARLRSLAEELAARTRALTASMNAAMAGLAELQALSYSESNPQTDLVLAGLSKEIDALREGLQEAQSLGRRTAAIHLLEV